MSNASDVADYILVCSQEHGDPPSNLKLQKLLYYSQAWYLALYDRPLFPERIEAWVHGPAVPPVYGRFKQWAWKPIDFQPATPPPLSTHVKDHVDEVLGVYGWMNGFELEQLTHKEYPWLNARGELAPDESSNAVISHEDMKTFYRNRSNEQNQQR